MTWGLSLVFYELLFLHLYIQRMFTNHINDNNSSEECWEVWLYSVCECTFSTITKLFHNHSNLLTSYRLAPASLPGKPYTHPSTVGSDLLLCLPDFTLGPHQSPSKVSHSKSLLPSSSHGFPSHSQGNADSSRTYVTWLLASILTKINLFSFIFLPHLLQSPLFLHFSWGTPHICLCILGHLYLLPSCLELSGPRYQLDLLIDFMQVFVLNKIASLPTSVSLYVLSHISGQYL